MELFTGSLCLIIVSALSLCGATEYYVRPSESTNTCPAQPCLTLNEYASHSEHYFTSSNIVLKFLPGTHLVNTSICVKSVHNVSFTGVESKKSPQIVLYKWSQRKNISCDQPTVKCASFGFMNATSVNISRLGVVVYPQNETVDSMRVLGITFRNVSRLHLHHCNITVIKRKTTNPYSFFSFGYSVYLSDSEFVTVAFSNIFCYQGSLYLTKSKNIEISNSMIVGGIEIHESVFAIISSCNVSLLMNGHASIIYIFKSRNISISHGVFMDSGFHGISIQYANYTRITNVTVLNCSETGLDLKYNIDTQVLNPTILFTVTGISIQNSNNTALQDVYLLQNDFGIDMESVVNINISNVYALVLTEYSLFLNQYPLLSKISLQ